MGSQEYSLDQGLAGKSQLWAAVSSLSVGACKERFTYRGPGQSGRAVRPVPHSPSPSPAETGAGVPLGGGGMPDAGAGASRHTLLSAQHAAGAQKWRPRWL